MIGGMFIVSFDSPTGDADNTNTSELGFKKAADSIAQACLKQTIKIDIILNLD